MRDLRDALRLIWFLFILIFALLVGATGGLLSWVDSRGGASAILYGAGAFAATVGLGLAVCHFLQQRP
ncbi:hypothetical protein [Micromonospora sp. ATCC 39149]|uniref:Uncharacterized protein n=1 Tax=Micromonospora carbonacea TaxID=47853 RepID=A0A7D5Y5V7_9ACTN|nr:hypothetical protein [Micromonospora sp. ATCC 39149]QLJ98518.1 hypothetical protein HZU44_28315 [Micromonospora carbonacea]